MTETEFWVKLLDEMVADGSLTEDESSEILNQLGVLM